MPGISWILFHLIICYFVFSPCTCTLNILLPALTFLLRCNIAGCAAVHSVGSCLLPWLFILFQLSALMLEFSLFQQCSRSCVERCLCLLLFLPSLKFNLIVELSSWNMLNTTPLLWLCSEASMNSASVIFQACEEGAAHICLGRREGVWMVRVQGSCANEAAWF